ncbi:MAG: GYD domain-containing protein [Candidatus Eremiobacteraeota bacterium]|nr:GYD domain-containing protein [Candidatus Eremiobacteraeota bacterium]MBV9056782.1 GYD domain-containing protein [Candidatus Eremiobacteraeota bacterium]MBV9701067.1 GYD domain-containing protein [Candidatus Eremiobacteraeota bacterium]
MAKFLVQANYTAEGTKGLLKTSGSQRRKAVEALIGSLGGKLEAFYFTFGESDAVLIIDLPDVESALSVGFAVRASGMVESKTTVLVSLDEVDRAVKRHADYSPPGA